MVRAAEAKALNRLAEVLRRIGPSLTIRWVVRRATLDFRYPDLYFDIGDRCLTVWRADPLGTVLQASPPF
jgi:hypothetical protein